MSSRHFNSARSKSLVRFKGGLEVMQALDEVRRKSPLRLKSAMADTLAVITRKSMAYTPIRTGHLRASHRTAVFVAGRQIIGVIYVMAVYAIYVHEASPSVIFRSKWPRGRKFLERAITDKADTLVQKVRRYLR